jgi:hypothetical protein
MKRFDCHATVHGLSLGASMIVELASPTGRYMLAEEVARECLPSIERDLIAIRISGEDTIELSRLAKLRNELQSILDGAK